MSLLLLLRNPAVAVGDGVLRNYVIGNDGTGDIVIGTLELEAGTGDVGAFTIEQDFVSGETISPGDTRGFKVRFDPTVAGTYLAAVRVPSSDADGTLTIALLGEAVDAPEPEIAVDPATHAFGSIDTASGSSARWYTVTNTGTGPLILGTVTIGGAGASSYAKTTDGVSGFTSAPGVTRGIMITFNPVSDGTKAGTLTFPSNAGADVVVAMTGIGTTAAPVTPPFLHTRFYLGRQASPLPAIEEGVGAWNGGTTDDDYYLTLSKGGPAVTYGESVPTIGLGGYGFHYRMGRWVSDPLAAQSYTGTYTAIMRCHRSTGLAANVTSAARFGIWRDATSEVEWQPVRSQGAALWAWTDSTNPMARHFPAGGSYVWPLTIGIQEGDRLVVELGYRAFTSANGSARIWPGGTSLVTDLVDAQTAQTSTLAPWIQFSPGIYVLPD